MSETCKTPEPPFYAVIFSSQRSGTDAAGYEAMARRMVELAADQPGFLGMESARDVQGFGITVSYWRDKEAIESWKHHAEHLQAQQTGRDRWYSSFSLHIARVDRTRRFEAGS